MIRLFGHAEIREAKAHAAAGGQALHVWQPTRVGWPGAPRVFRRAATAGESWAHLYDADIERLIETARRLGVLRVVVHRAGQPGQHVDLCGRPLRRAMSQAGERGDPPSCAPS